MELIAEGVYKTLQKKVILNNINLKLYSGNIYAFIGRNGSGKTMLFRALSGLIKCDSGKIVLDGMMMPVMQFVGNLIAQRFLSNAKSGNCTGKCRTIS